MELQGIPDFLNIQRGFAEVPQRFGEQMTSALSGLSASIKEREQERKRKELADKAEQIHAMAEREWDDPNSKLFGGLKESQKYRRLSELMAPVDLDAKNTAFKLADEWKAREDESAQKSESEWNKGTLEREKRESEERIEMAKLAAKSNEPKEAKPEDRKQMANELWASFGYGPDAYALVRSKYNDFIGPIPEYSAGPEAVRSWAAAVGSGVPQSVKLGGEVEKQNLDIAGQKSENVIKDVGAKQSAIESARLLPPEGKNSLGGIVKYVGVPKVLEPEISKANERYDNAQQVAMDQIRSGEALLETIKNHTSPDGTLGGMSNVSAITQYNKMIDPKGVVRDSDIQLAVASGGLLGRITSMLNSLNSGNTMKAERVEELKQLAIEANERIKKALERLQEKYGSIAIRNGVDPFHVLGRDSKDYEDNLRAAGIIP